MLQFVIDTDHLTLLGYGHPLVTHRCAMKVPGALGLPVVTVEEHLRGRLSAIVQAKDGVGRMLQYSLLERSLRLIHPYPIAPFDPLAEDQFQILRAMRLRIGTRDQKIAAIALANNVILCYAQQARFRSGSRPGYRRLVRVIRTHGAS